MKPLKNSRGVTLIEILVSLVIIAVASIGTLQFFSQGMGGVSKQGNRRAAMEQARARLEQMMAVNAGTLTPVDGSLYYAFCNTNPCTLNLTTVQTAEEVEVNGKNRKIESTLQLIDDPTSRELGDPTAQTLGPDVLVLSVKVWFTSNTTLDDDFNRVLIQTLRTP
jgi:prepilin-type N-terminal cleavage/methylation domain-containing protein